MISNFRYRWREWTLRTRMLRTESHKSDLSGRSYSLSVTPPGHAPEDGAVYSNSSDYHTPSLASIYQVSWVQSVPENVPMFQLFQQHWYMCLGLLVYSSGLNFWFHYYYSAVQKFLFLVATNFTSEMNIFSWLIVLFSRVAMASGTDDQGSNVQPPLIIVWHNLILAALCWSPWVD